MSTTFWDDSEGHVPVRDGLKFRGYIRNGRGRPLEFLVPNTSKSPSKSEDYILIQELVYKFFLFRNLSENLLSCDQLYALIVSGEHYIYYLARRRRYFLHFAQCITRLINI